MRNPAHRKGFATEHAVASVLLAAGYDVALPIGCPDHDLVCRAAPGHPWATVQVKSVARIRQGTRVIDTRAFGGGLYAQVDFLIAYDLETHDFWVFPTEMTQRQITLDSRLPGFRSLEPLHELPRCRAENCDALRHREIPAGVGGSAVD